MQCSAASASIPTGFALDAGRLRIRESANLGCEDLGLSLQSANIRAASPGRISRLLHRSEEVCGEVEGPQIHLDFAEEQNVHKEQRVTLAQGGRCLQLRGGGLLVVGTPLSFGDSLQYLGYVREHGILQVRRVCLHSWSMVGSASADTQLASSSFTCTTPTRIAATRSFCGVRNSSTTSSRSPSSQQLFNKSAAYPCRIRHCFVPAVLTRVSTLRWIGRKGACVCRCAQQKSSTCSTRGRTRTGAQTTGRKRAHGTLSTGSIPLSSLTHLLCDLCSAHLHTRERESEKQTPQRQAHANLSPFRET